MVLVAPESLQRTESGLKAALSGTTGKIHRLTFPQGTLLSRHLWRSTVPYNRCYLLTVFPLKTLSPCHRGQSPFCLAPPSGLTFQMKASHDVPIGSAHITCCWIPCAGSRAGTPCVGGSQADGSYADSKGGRARKLLLSAEGRIYIPETQGDDFKSAGQQGGKKEQMSSPLSKRKDEKLFSTPLFSISYFFLP